jgi:hypothetical protein
MKMEKSWALVVHTVIIATQEAEIRRIVVQNQLGQVVGETDPVSKKNHPHHKKGLVK